MLVIRDGLEGRQRHDKLRPARRRPPQWADARFTLYSFGLNILSHHVILTDAYYVLRPCLRVSFHVLQWTINKQDMFHRKNV
jgi:hypothetical protein